MTESNAASAANGASVAAGPRPVLLIASGRAPWAAEAREIWAYRELLFFLVWRDVRVRYRQSVLGALWAILQPLASMLIFALMFGRLAGFATPEMPYPLFAYSGLVLWTFFANAVTAASNSLVNSAYLVTKVYFPRLIIPAAAVVGSVVDFAFALLPLALLLAWYRVPPRPAWLLAPLVFLATALLATGVGTLFAAVNVRFRDVRHAIPVLVQLWMFASPTFYPTSLVPERFRWALALNPMAQPLESFRHCLTGTRPEPLAVTVAAALILALLVTGLHVFRRMERSFADAV